MSYLGAHLHLADPGYRDRLDSVLQDAAQGKVQELLSNAVDYGTSLETINLAKQYRGRVLAAIGTHPWTVTNTEGDYSVDKFEQLLNDGSQYVKAIGEIGLDGKYSQDQAKKQAQRKIFQFFLGLAEKRKLPAIVHSRLAASEVLDILSSFNPPKVLLHWHDGPIENLSLIKDRGYLISVTPSLLYSRKTVEIARNADIDIILSKTDGPVSYHRPLEGRMPVPSLVANVIRKLAEIKSVPTEIMRDTVWNNFQQLIPDRNGN